MGDYGIPDVVEEQAGDQLRRYRPSYVEEGLLVPWPRSTVECYYLSKSMKVESNPSAAFDIRPITQEERVKITDFLKRSEERESKGAESSTSQRSSG